MIFAILLMDRPGTADLRTKVRPAHRDYLALQANRMAFSGPLTTDDGKTDITASITCAIGPSTREKKLLNDKELRKQQRRLESHRKYKNISKKGKARSKKYSKNLRKNS